MPLNISRAEFNRIKRLKRAKKERLSQKREDTDALMALSRPADGPTCQESEIYGPGGASCLKSNPRAILGHTKKKKNKKSARRAAFDRLETLCRTFVLMRAKRRNRGFCEIGLACGGNDPANTWYHGWPQKGGNGLKYDVRSHFASCSRCNMGEYGERMRGGDRYINRHKEILGAELWAGLNALHGRRPISIVESREMIAELERKINARKFV